MSDLSDAITSLNNAADRATATTEFFDTVTTGGDTETVTNPNNNKTVPTVQKQVKDLVDENIDLINDAVDDAEGFATAASTSAGEAATSASEAQAAADSIDIITIARSLNVEESQVIYSTDTTTVLDDVLYIYDSSAQTTWGKPSDVGSGEYIVSVVGDVLTTGVGSYSLQSLFMSVSIFESVDDMINSQWLTEGMTVKTCRYNADVVSTWSIVSTGSGDMSDATISLNNGLFAKLNISGSLVNALEFGATGVKGEDQTDSLQKALTYGQTLRSDFGFVFYFPMGDYEATHLSVDRSVVNRNVIFAGEGTSTDDVCSNLILTDTTQESGMEWDGGFHAINMGFVFEGARAYGTLSEPRWTIDIRNVDSADSVADIDVSFINCTFRDFHRAVKLTGRGFKFENGRILNGGGATTEGCFLDLDIPEPFVSGSEIDQTSITGMRAYRFISPRIHACTGHLVRNKGTQANNLAQLQITDVFCDTSMGLIRGAVRNVELSGGTYLYNPAIMFWIEDGFDLYNLSASGVNLIGMPEENIGQSTSGGTVTEAEVLARAVGNIIFVSSGAGVVENVSWNGGIISDGSGSNFVFTKAIDGFMLTNVACRNLLKDNKTSSGSTRHVVDFSDTASKNIIIKNNIVNNLTMTKDGNLVGNMSSITDYSIEDNFLSGSIFETYTLPRDSDFGGDQSSVYCGSYTGDGGNSTRYTASRYIKGAVVCQQSGDNQGATWMAKDGDLTADVRVSGQALITLADASLSGETYSYMLFF